MANLQLIGFTDLDEHIFAGSAVLFSVLNNEEVRNYLIEIALWIDGAPQFGEWHRWLSDLKTDGWHNGIMINALSEAEREQVREAWESQAEWRAACLAREDDSAAGQ